MHSDHVVIVLLLKLQKVISITFLILIIILTDHHCSMRIFMRLYTCLSKSISLNIASNMKLIKSRHENSARKTRFYPDLTDDQIRSGQLISLSRAYRPYKQPDLLGSG